MFTGIVQDVGRVQVLEPRGGDVQMVIEFDRMDPAGIRIGDSICVQGCCLTATQLLGRAFAADVSRETLNLTTLGDLRAGTPVNLEPSLKAGDSLGGHAIKRVMATPGASARSAADPATGQPRHHCAARAGRVSLGSQ